MPTPRLMLLGLASAGAVMSSPVQAAPCAVTVEFASHCCGIDSAAYKDLMAFLSASDLVVSHESKAWGREGEQTICVVTGTRAAADTLLGQLKARLPAKPARGSIKVTGGDANFPEDTPRG